jgi:Uma2 family endonuclease
MTNTILSTTDALAHIPEHRKAELVHGVVVELSPTGFLPNYVAGEIYTSLRTYARAARSGYAIADNAGFLVDLPQRQSFSPDAAFYTGTPSGMRFLEGAPVFAVEVRSANDYGSVAERELVEKRADYFLSGTRVVWVVDILSDDVIRVYRSDTPELPTIYRRGMVAEAEPAVPGWTLPVDDLFPLEVGFLRQSDAPALRGSTDNPRLRRTPPRRGRFTPGGARRMGCSLGEPRVQTPCWRIYKQFRIIP